MIIKNGSLLQCSSAFKPKYLILYPFRYLIQLISGARTEHSALYLSGKVHEMKLAGLISNFLSNWFGNLDKQIDVYLYQLKEDLTENQILALESFIESVRTAKYSIIQHIFSKIIFLRSIPFKKNKYLFCNQFYIEALKHINLLPPEVDSRKYTPDQVPDLLDRYNLIEGRRVIK